MRTYLSNANDYTHVRVVYGMMAVNVVQTILLGLILLG